MARFVMGHADGELVVATRARKKARQAVPRRVRVHLRYETWLKMVDLGERPADISRDTGFSIALVYKGLNIARVNRRRAQALAKEMDDRAA